MTVVFRTGHTLRREVGQIRADALLFSPRISCCEVLALSEAKLQKLAPFKIQTENHP